MPLSMQTWIAALKDGGRQLGEQDRPLTVAVFVVSWFVSATVYLFWVSPTEPTLYGVKPGPGDWFAAVTIGGLGYLLLWAFLFSSSSGLKPTMRTLVISALLIPVGLAIWGATLQDRQGHWREGVRAFDELTGRFPRGSLGPARVVSEHSSVTTVCAEERRSHGVHLCVETITDPLYEFEGDYDVMGMFRYRASDQRYDLGQPRDMIVARFDCTGRLREDCF